MTQTTNTYAIAKLLIFSGLGIFAFFVPFEMAGKPSILLDHVVTLINQKQHPLAVAWVVGLIIFGAVYPFFSRHSHQLSDTIFWGFKILGAVIAGLYLLDLAPRFLVDDKSLLPFLFDKLVMSVGLLIPIGAIALTFLIGYGLLESVGVLMQPIMRPLFKTPGYAAIDAVASFVGSYSLGLLITNRMFLAGKYSAKEAAIIATGFSTVSATFMVVVAKTLALMPMWNFYFWSTLFITFLVTAISVHLPPLRGIDNTRQETEQALDAPRLLVAWRTGINQAAASEPLPRLMYSQFRDALIMAGNVLPSILSIGLLGLLLAKYTPVFTILGYVLWPFVQLLQLPEASQVSQGLASSLAEMFLPAIMLKDSDLLVRYITGVFSVSSIIFFSGLVPCILATQIPINVRQILVIWLIRSILSLLIAGVFGYIALAAGYLI